MATIDFNMVITNEAITYARQASNNPGWFLQPTKWMISSSSGTLSVERTTDSMYTPWIQSPFSGVFASGTNKLLHSIVIPPDAYDSEIAIGEIYFIYKDYFGNEFLYAIAQPTGALTFTPGVSQSYSFVFTLNNVTVADTVLISYSYPQDIEDHNLDPKAHEDHLLARDGSRTLTDILKYEKKLSFNNNREIVDKEYVDTAINPVVQDINNIYCPPGSMMWWPKSTPPTGWLVRDGSAYPVTSYPNLYAVIGNTYGGNNQTFNVPDDRGRFIRGYLAGTTAGFGQIQNDGLPNITGGIVVNQGRSWGAFYDSGSDYIWGGGRSDSKQNGGRAFNAARSSGIYGAANEVRPKNRNYLPIIKY